jgi:hypothetical protein
VRVEGKESRLPAYWFRARRPYILKNYGRWYTMLADATFILAFGIWRLRRRIQRKPDADYQSIDWQRVIEFFDRSLSEQ